MATRRTTVIQSLSIALIVFVTLTFVLAVTTYLFFTQKEIEVGKTAEANAAKEEATRKFNALVTEKEKLQKLIGFEPERAVDEVEGETSQAFDVKYSDFKEDPRSLMKLAEWLQEGIKKKDEELKGLEEEKKQLVTKTEADLKERDEKITALEKELEAVKADAVSEKEKLEAALASNEQERQKIATQYDEALKQATDYQRLQEKVAEGEPFVSGSRQTRFKTQSPEERVGAMMEELRERERAIAQANAVLATLRGADPAVQEAVLAATPKDDRIDGFDGRVISVNDVDRTVLILADSTRGLRPGLIMYVYDPDDPTPQFDAKKGVVEVIGVESPTLFRAGVRQDTTANPILGGDGVATSLWTPGETFEAVILGFVQIDRDERPDADRLAELVAAVGGTVAEAVSPQTTLVVDAGVPRMVGGERAAGWRPADDTRREKQLREARRLGLKVVGLDDFLRMLGLERDSLDANRLPQVGERLDVSRQPPSR